MCQIKTHYYDSGDTKQMQFADSCNLISEVFEITATKFTHEEK